jgi:hypothetical protein
VAQEGVESIKTELRTQNSGVRRTAKTKGKKQLFLSGGADANSIYTRRNGL